MSTYAEATDIVRRFLAARVPLIVIETIEPTRAMALLYHCAQSLPSMAYYVHSRTEGLREMVSNTSVSDDTSLHVALDQARTTFQARPHCNFVFTDVEDTAEESSMSRHLSEMVRLAEQREGSIILLTDKPIWRGLSRLGMSVILDLPTSEEMEQKLGAIIDDHRPVMPIEWQFDEIRRASETLAGVTEGEAVNVIASLLASGKLANSDLDQLSEYKDRILGSLSGIERVQMREDYKIGGLRNLRAWLASHEKLMKCDLSQTTLHSLRGILLVGVPGCGKSLSAKAIAADWRLPLYRLDMASILGMYVGQSEARLKDALAAAEQVAPCVLWVDEIEKALSDGGGGDSGVTRRLIGQFLYWLQESTAKVFMIATANEVTSLPPELLRKGRFDELFFVDLPDPTDREEILRLYFAKYLHHDVPAQLCQELVELTDGFSGSDLDAAVHDINVHMYTHDSTAVPSEAEIKRFFVNVVPYSQTNPEDVAAIRQWGLSRCVPAGATGSPSVSHGQPTSSRRVMIH